VVVCFDMFLSVWYADWLAMVKAKNDRGRRARYEELNRRARYEERNLKRCERFRIVLGRE
jgi:hypothetical protein